MAGLTVTQLSHALAACAGNVTQAAAQLAITRQHLHRRIAASPVLQAIVEDERESLADIAESQLRIALNKGDMTAIIWTLKASPAAKARGWGEKQEIGGPNNGPLQVAVVKGYIGINPDEWDADGNTD